MKISNASLFTSTETNGLKKEVNKASSSEIASKMLTEYFQSSGKEQVQIAGDNTPYAKNPGTYEIPQEFYDYFEKVLKFEEETGLTMSDVKELQDMYKKGYSKAEIQKRMKEMKAKNAAENAAEKARQAEAEKRNQEIEDFKANHKASNGMTYNEATETIEKIRNKYAHLFNRVFWVDRGEGNGKGKYVHAPEEEVLARIPRADAYAYREAKKAIAELDEKLKQKAHDDFKEITGLDVPLY